MKVLLIVHQFLPRHVTGTEQYVRSVALELRARGIDCHVFAVEPLLDPEVDHGAVISREECVEGIPVRRVGIDVDLMPNHALRDYQNPVVGGLLGEYLDRHGFDLVHVFHLRLTGVDGIQQPRLRGIPVVVNLMDFWFLCANYLLWHRDGHLCDGPPEGGWGCVRCTLPEVDRMLRDLRIDEATRALGSARSSAGVDVDHPASLAHALMGRKEVLLEALDQAAAIIAPSRFLRGIFTGFGVEASRVLHVPYGLDFGRFENMPERKRPGAGRVDIGYMGSISKHKGVHVLLEALGHCRSTEDQLRIHIFGRVRSQPGFSESLVASCEDPRVEFHGKFMPTELGRVVAGLDALCVPSLWYENTPFSVLEALHVGLPVIASDLGGISEIVVDRVNGRLFPAGDAKALAAVIDEIVAAPERELQVTRSASLSIQDNCDRFVEIYRDVGAGC